MKKIVYILLLFAVELSFHSARAGEADSLRRVLESLPQNDTTRLVNLRRIVFLRQSTPSGLEAAQELYREAERMESIKYMADAAYFTSVFYYNKGITDSISIYSTIAMRLAEKEGLWKTYFEAARISVNALVVNDEYEYAIDEASKMYEKANDLHYFDGKVTAAICLATSYIASSRVQESVQVLKEIYSDSEKISSPAVRFSVLNLLVSTAYYTHNYDDLYLYLTALEKGWVNLLKRHSYQESFHMAFMFIDIYYAYYYTAIGQPEKALEYLHKVDRLKSNPVFSAYSNIYYDAYAEYFKATRQYDRAIEAIDSSFIDMNSLMPKDYYMQLTKKADILSETGRYGEALTLYHESLLAKDSIDHILSSKQMEQIQSIHNVNRLVLENEQLKLNRQIIILCVILIVIALLLAFTIRALFVRAKLKESEHEMREASQTAEEANEIKNMFLSNMSYNIRMPLNSVVGFSQLLATDPDMDEKQRKEYSTIIKKNSEVLLNLVNDVLDLSRLEAGMMKFNLQKYDVITLCREAIYTAKSKGQPVEIDFRPQFEEYIITVDTFRFCQMLVSLLSYPTPVSVSTSITLTVSLDKNKKFLRFKTIGSPIANAESITQEVAIRNEINKLFLKRFGGTYHINTETAEGATIVFTYPLSISE